MKRTNRKYPSSYVKANSNSSDGFDIARKLKIVLDQHGYDGERFLKTVKYETGDYTDLTNSDDAINWLCAITGWAPNDYQSQDMSVRKATELYNEAMNIDVSDDFDVNYDVTNFDDMDLDVTDTTSFSGESAVSAIASALGLPNNLAQEVYNWYDMEGSTDDYDDVHDFVDFVCDDIYDMLDACTDAELRREIGSYVGYDIDEDEDF